MKRAVILAAAIFAIAGIGAGWTWDEDHAAPAAEGSTIIAEGSTIIA